MARHLQTLLRNPTIELCKSRSFRDSVYAFSKKITKLAILGPSLELAFKNMSDALCIKALLIEQIALKAKSLHEE